MNFEELAVITGIKTTIESKEENILYTFTQDYVSPVWHLRHEIPKIVGGFVLEEYKEDLILKVMEEWTKYASTIGRSSK